MAYFSVRRSGLYLLQEVLKDLSKEELIAIIAEVAGQMRCLRIHSC